MTGTIRTLFQPRTLLIGMMAIGGLFLAYILLSASFSGVERPWDDPEAGVPLASGSVAGLERTEFPRGAPEVLLTVPGEEDPAYLPDLVGGGQVTVVNLWASWCAPCIEELPSLVAMADRTGARIVPIAMERPSEAQGRTLAKAGVLGAFPPYADPSLSLMGAYGRDLQLPLSILYDGRGRERGRIAGAVDWTSPEAMRLIAAVRDGV